MANATYTSESEPAGNGGPGIRWYKPSTHEWYTWAGGAWVIDQDGFDFVKIADLTVSGSVTSDGETGLTGEYEGTFKKIKVVNGIITEFELE